MLQDMIHPPEQLPIEDLSSPISAQMFQFCEHDLFPEILQNSEVSSCSNCCYEDISYTTDLSSSIPSDVGSFNSGSSTTTTTNNNNKNHLSTIFDSQDENETDISVKSFFSSQPPTFPIPPPHLLTNQDHDQFDLSSLQSQIPISDIVNGFSSYSPDQVVQLTAPPVVPSIFEDDCLASLPSYVNLNPSSPSCSFMDPTVGQYFPGNMSSSFSTDVGIFAGPILMGSELQPQELEFHGDNGGVYGSEPVQYSLSGEIQALDNQQLVNGGGGKSTPLATELSTLEESSYKIGRLSFEERKEKIHRYKKKRNERNFSKKIKYACRKALADSRPRVRGRFAKNDDFGETTRPSCIIHEDEEDEILVKEEDEMIDTSDIFAHISGVNSFKCNYPIQSWI